MKEDKLKDLFKNKLYNHETKTHPTDWEIISKRMQQSKRKPVIKWLYAGVGLGVAASLLLFLLLPTTRTTTENQNNYNIAHTVAPKDSVQNKPAEEINIIADNSPQPTNKTPKNTTTTKPIRQTEKHTTLNTIGTIKTIDTIIIEEKQNLMAKSTAYNNEEIKKHLELLAIAAATADDYLEEEYDHYIDDNDSDNYTNAQTQKTLNNDNEFRYWAENDFNSRYDKKHSSHFTLAVISSQNMNNSSPSSDYSNKVFSQQQLQLFSTSKHEKSNNFSTLRQGNLLTSKDFAISEKIDLKHKRPINVGIRITSAFSKNINFKTGLSYSYFLSEYINTDLKIQQELHYIGIPIGLEYSFIQSKNFKLYLSSEFTVEKGISMRYKELGNTSSNISYSVNKSNHIKRLQFSLTSGLGLSYNFTKNVGIYAEPSLLYYIKDSNQPESFRTKNSLNLNVSFGLKYEFK